MPASVENLGLQSFFQKELLSKETLQVTPPIGLELFLAGENPKGFLPKEISENTVLLEEAKKRRVLYEEINSIFKEMPNIKTEIGEAIDKNLINQENLIDFYKNLTDFIEADTNNTRIILYLPFEILPNLNQKSGKSETLVKTENDLVKTYKDAWIRLLFESECRASFTDGDVLEEGLGEPERIRKAAHLIPEILERGLIDFTDIKAILEINRNDKELVKSLNEGVAVAIDKKLIDEIDMELIDFSWPGERKKIKYEGNISKERLKWEEQIKKDQELDMRAKQLAKTAIKNEEALKDEPDLTVKAKAIFEIGEKTGIKKYEPLIEQIWNFGTIEAKDEIISGLSRLEKLGIVQKSFLAKLGIKLPDFEALLPIDYNEMVSRDFGYLKEAVSIIEKDEKLSELIYPVFLICGSRVKGYARLDADHDAAIFIKPEVPLKERNNLLQSLAKKIPDLLKIDKFLEYWMSEDENKLNLRQIKGINAIAGPSQINFFVGGIWLGKQEEIKKIQGDIIERYLDLSRFENQKEQTRTHLLGQMELDIIQYRLMHKGFDRFYPSQRKKPTEHSFLIDYENNFWDPVFRRIATKLFLSKVFLPDLSE